MKLQVRAQSSTFYTFLPSITNSHPCSHGGHVMPSVELVLPVLWKWVKLRVLWSHELYLPHQFKLSNNLGAQIDEHFLKQKSWLKQSLFSSLHPSMFFLPSCCCTAVLLAQLCCGVCDEASGDKSSCFSFVGYLKASSIPWSCPPYTEAQNR